MNNLNKKPKVCDNKTNNCSEMHIPIIKSKTFFSYFKVGMLLILVSLLSCTQSIKKPEKLNVLFISVDDLRPDLGVYDNPYIKTPNIDLLAAEGITFRNNYCQAAVCAPSRASLMTGVRPNTNQVWHLGDKFREINPDIVTMPQHFHKFGYRTVNIGKIFHNYMPDSVSWDEPDLRPSRYLRPEWLKRDGETFYVNKETNRKQKIKRDSLVTLRPNYYADGWNNGPAWEMEDVHDTMYFDGAQTKLAIQTLQRLSKSKQPFYLALGYFRPHLPFAVPKKYWDLYNRDSIPLARNPFVPKNSPIMSMNSMYELRGYDGFSHLKHPSLNSIGADTAKTLKHGYYASVSYIDAQIAKLIKALKDLKLYNNTIIILWGDYGWKLGEHNSWCKQSNYNIDIQTPMIIYSPNHKKQMGKQTFAITELVDIFPSLCELSDIKVPDYMEGISFVPLMENPEQKWKSAAFSQFHRRPKVTPDGKRYMGYSMKTNKFHYIEWYYWDNISQKKGDFVSSELYDHEIDADENENIADYEENAELIKELSRQLKKGWKGAIPINE